MAGRHEVIYCQVVLWTLMGCLWPTMAQSKIEEGRLFPRIVLPSLETGAPLSMTDFLGKKTILHIFASW